MKLTVIGYYGAYPEKNTATSAYLIEHKNTKVLLDCGSGVLSQLQNYIELKELDAIVISHFHSDHCADIECMQYAVMIDTLRNKRGKKLDIWAGGDAEKINKLNYRDYCVGKNYRNLEEFSIGELKFEISLNYHEIESYAIKVTDSYNNSLVYSGDTGFYDAFIEFSKNADCLLCECSLYNYQKGKILGHLTAGEVGQIADKANVKEVILTHLPHYGDISILEKEAKDYYKYNVQIAYKGLTKKFYKNI